MDIGLAPGSLRFYAMENGLLRVAIPPPGATNRTVSVNVRYIGRRKPEGKGGETLRPSLIFQARVRAGAEEVMVYGAPCKVAKKNGGAKPQPDEFDYED
jgi:hypothetical protein